MDSTAETEISTAEVELAKYLWEEFRYRHDLIWRLLFRVTVVATLLLITPLTNPDLRDEVDAAADVLPALALALVLASWPVIYFEFKHFERIDALYVDAQKRAVAPVDRSSQVEPTGEKRNAFKSIVYLYLLVLAVLVLLGALVTWGAI